MGVAGTIPISGEEDLSQIQIIKILVVHEVDIIVDSSIVNY